MHVLYMATAGSSDATRASIPLHLAVNGSIEVGQRVTIVLAGDAAELARADVRDAAEGLGLPPARDLFAKARQHEIPVFVWKGCAVARGVTDDDLAAIGGQWSTPPDVANLIADADRVVAIWTISARVQGPTRCSMSPEDHPAVPWRSSRSCEEVDVGLDGARQHLDVAVGIDRDDPRYSRVGVIIADDDVVPANDVAL